MLISSLYLYIHILVLPMRCAVIDEMLNFVQEISSAPCLSNTPGIGNWIIGTCSLRPMHGTQVPKNNVPYIYWENKGSHYKIMKIHGLIFFKPVKTMDFFFTPSFNISQTCKGSKPSPNQNKILWVPSQHGLFYLTSAVWEVTDMMKTLLLHWILIVHMQVRVTTRKAKNYYKYF